MATSVFKRLLASSSVPYTATLAANMITEINGNFYIPISFDDFDSDLITVNQVNGAANAFTLSTNVVGAFDNIRVGDFIDTVSSGSLADPATITRSCFTAKGLKYIIYPDTYTPSTLSVRAGDQVTGTNIPDNTFVDKIDYNTRQIFITNAATDSSVETLTFAPKIRVIAVRKSTANSGANQIDLNTTVQTAINNATVTIKGGANEAVCLVLKLKPVNTDTTKSRFRVEVSYQSGYDVRGSASGYNDLDFANLSYVLAADINFDADTFLLNARVSRPTSL